MPPGSVEGAHDWDATWLGTTCAINLIGKSSSRGYTPEVKVHSINEDSRGGIRTSLRNKKNYDLYMQYNQVSFQFGLTFGYNNDKFEWLEFYSKGTRK